MDVKTKDNLGTDTDNYTTSPAKPFTAQASLILPRLLQAALDHVSVSATDKRKHQALTKKS